MAKGQGAERALAAGGGIIGVGLFALVKACTLAAEHPGTLVTRGASSVGDDIARAATHSTSAIDEASRAGTSPALESAAAARVVPAQTDNPLNSQHDSKPISNEQAQPAPPDAGSSKIAAAEGDRRNQERAAIEAVTSLSRLEIVDEVQLASVTLTSEQIEAIVSHAIAKSAEAVAHRPGSAVEFEAATGKLKITGSYTVGAAKITVGQVNIYKLSAIAGAGIAACRHLAASRLDECVDNALRKATDVVTDVKWSDLAALPPSN